MRKFLVPLLFTATFLVAQAQEKVLFKLNPEYGKTNKYEFDYKIAVDRLLGMRMDNNLQTQNTYSMQIQTTYSKTQDSLINVANKFTQARVEINTAGTMDVSYDSSKKPLNETEKMIATQFKPLIENKLTYVTNKSGAIKSVDFPNVSEEIFDKSNVNIFFVVTFPNHPISIGESWTNTKLVSNDQQGLIGKTKYTLLERNNDGYKIGLNITMENNAGEAFGSSTGYFIVHPKTYLTIASSTISTIEIQGSTVKTSTELREIK